MKTGAGRAKIGLPVGFLPTEGFVCQAHALHARCLILGEDDPFALVSVEMTSLMEDECRPLRALAAGHAGVREERVWLTVTHTFSAPHILPDGAMKTEADRQRREALRASLREAVCEAAARAREDLAQRDCALLQGHSAIPASRDIELPEGWWVGCGGKGERDDTLTALRFSRENRVEAVLLHLNVQPSVLDGTGARDGKCVSGDFVGVACSLLERKYPGAVALFLIGAAGDQAPVRRAIGYVPGADGYEQIDLHEAGAALAGELGAALAGEAEALLERPGEALCGEVRLLSGSVTVPAKVMNRNLRELKPSRSCAWIPDGKNTQPFEWLTLGSLAVLGVRPELTVTTLHQIQAGSPFAHTLAATLVNGGAKYMADESAYARCTYEAQNSPFAPGGAEKLAQAALRLINGEG